MTIHETIDPKAKDFALKNHLMLVDGNWIDATSGDRIDVINPANGRVYTSIPSGGADDVDLAVDAASRALKSDSWAKMQAKDREKLLWKIADLIEENAEELAQIESLDNGIPIRFARAVNVPSIVNSFRYYAGWCTKINGKNLTLSRSNPYHAYSSPEPVGVVGLIIPWNVPLMLAGWKLAPALAAGCTCVLKPSEETSLSMLRVAELMMEAGLPKGVVNIITGYGASVGAAITSHEDVKKIAFTGSTAVGKEIVKSSLGNLKKVSLELGGKSPVIIMPDANLEAAIPSAAMGIFFNTGQVCAAGSRLYVHGSIFDQVVSGIAEMAKQLKIGPGHLDDTMIGPLVNAAQHNRVTGYVASGLEEGAKIVAGGEKSGDDGYYYQPTVMTNVREDMKIVREEIFGPVLAANKFDDVDEALSMANDSEYGLVANVWTKDLSMAHYLVDQLEAGTVTVNGGGGPDNNLPFGGIKQSGWGQELGEEGLKAYLNYKSVEMSIS